MSHTSQSDTLGLRCHSPISPVSSAIIQVSFFLLFFSFLFFFFLSFFEGEGGGEGCTKSTHDVAAASLISRYLSGP